MNKIIKELRNAPELQAVEIIESEKDGINLYFKEGTQRTGHELQAVTSILIKNKIFNFIKHEKVLLFKNEIKKIGISFY